MPTIDAINAQKDVAVAVLDQKILDGITLKNAGQNGMDAPIHDLMVQRTAVYLQAYTAALNSQEMTAALAALTAATAEMNTVAAVMVSATKFISNVASFLGASNKVISALQGKG